VEDTAKEVIISLVNLHQQTRLLNICQTTAAAARITCSLVTFSSELIGEV